MADIKEPDYARISNTMGKMAVHLKGHNSICVGVSGGSDSNVIVHMIATYFREFLPKIHFAFQNTGLEYDATLRHLDYMEEHYQIKIDRIRGEPVPKVVREFGVPILSKSFSETIEAAQNGVSWGVKRAFRTKRESSFGFTEKQLYLARFLVEHPEIRISNKCCELSKKKPFTKYLKDHNADLRISGERKCEGGQRASAHKDCFEPKAKKHIDKYMPLFFWDDATKAYYKAAEGITYSDCYEIWGKKRTGCVGCPFNSRAGEELRLLQKYEPLKYRACMAVFGESYRLMDRFSVHRHKILEEERPVTSEIPVLPGQIDIEDYITEVRKKEGNENRSD